MAATSATCYRNANTKDKGMQKKMIINLVELKVINQLHLTAETLTKCINKAAGKANVPSS